MTERQDIACTLREAGLTYKQVGKKLHPPVTATQARHLHLKALRKKKNIDMGAHVFLSTRVRHVLKNAIKGPFWCPGPHPDDILLQKAFKQGLLEKRTLLALPNFGKTSLKEIAEACKILKIEVDLSVPQPAQAKVNRLRKKIERLEGELRTARAMIDHLIKHGS